MVGKNKPGKLIRIRPDTVIRIDKLKPRGQTYDGFIATMLNSYEKDISAISVQEAEAH